MIKSEEAQTDRYPSLCLHLQLSQSPKDGGIAALTLVLGRIIKSKRNFVFVLPKFKKQI